MRILITGAHGMLGTDLVDTLAKDHEIAGLSRDQLDICNPAEAARVIAAFLPETIINTAAMTDVDGCEIDPEAAFKVNADGAAVMAAEAARCGACLVHYSTDYVFDGTRPEPYREDDPPAPANVYGRSKLKGEEDVRSRSPQHLILRTSWLFGRKGRNFIRTILRSARAGHPMRVVNDQRGSPTYTRDLAEHTKLMVERRCRGTYHVTNQGSCTWFELAQQVLDWSDLKVAVTPVSSSEYPRPARRPANSVMANSRLEREGIGLMRPWNEAVEEYVRTCLE